MGRSASSALTGRVRGRPRLRCRGDRACRGPAAFHARRQVSSSPRRLRQKSGKASAVAPCRWAATHAYRRAVLEAAPSDEEAWLRLGVIARRNSIPSDRARRPPMPVSKGVWAGSRPLRPIVTPLCGFDKCFPSITPAGRHEKHQTRYSGRGLQYPARSADMRARRSFTIRRLWLVPSPGPRSRLPATTMPDPVDIITDFDRGADRLPSELADKLRGRQRAVAGKRRRAQLNEGLLRFRVRGWRRRKTL